MKDKQKKGNGLINPNQEEKKKEKKPVKIHNDGLMEREDDKVLTEDGRQLLNS